MTALLISLFYWCLENCQTYWKSVNSHICTIVLINLFISFAWTGALVDKKGGFDDFFKDVIAVGIILTSTLTVFFYALGFLAWTPFAALLAFPFLFGYTLSNLYGRYEESKERAYLAPARVLKGAKVVEGVQQGGKDEDDCCTLQKKELRRLHRETEQVGQPVQLEEDLESRLPSGFRFRGDPLL